MSAKLITFSDLGFRGSVIIFTTNDNNLLINGQDFEFSSAIAITGNWELFSEPSRGGENIELRTDGGSDNDGTYEDYAAWEGVGPFHVQSIYHDQ